jgi:tetratricopeptide (TPR) repeat protein
MKRLVVFGILLIAVLSVNAQNAAEKIKQANEALTAKDYAKAFQLFDEAMKNLGDVKIDASFNYNIGFTAFQAGKFPEAIVYLDKAIEAGANVSKSWELKANIYIKQNDYTNAVNSYLKAAETSGDGGKDYIFNAAATAYKGELWDKAIELFKKSVELGNKGETAQYYIAMTYKKLKKTDECKQTLTEGLEKFPGDKKLSEMLAKEYVNDGNKIYQQGSAIMNAANQKVTGGTLKTNDAVYKAEVEKAKVQFKAACAILEKAVALDAANTNATKLLNACKQCLAI